MSDWIAIYEPPADNEPPFECLVRGDVFDNCVWVGGPIGQYAQVTGSIAMPLPYMPSHWRPAQSAAVKESLTSQEPVNVSTLTLNAADSAEFSTSAKDSGTCEMTTQQALDVVGISVDGVSREALVAIVRRLQAENERLRNNVLVLGDNQQPVAEYDGVEFSRYTLRWINGVMPVGTKLYAPPVFDVQAEKNRHDAEELEALHMNLRDNNVPTHDENGEPFSAWGRVLWFAEKRNAMPVRYVSLQHIKTKVTDANPNPVQVNVISERNGAWLDMPREMTNKPFGNYCHKHGKGMFNKCQDCMDELVNLGIQADKERIAKLEQRLAVAVDTLKDAKEKISDWGEYASTYFQEKYDLKGDIEHINVVLATLETKN